MKKLFKSAYTIPLILSLAWPTMLEQLLQTAVQYIDTAMVGSLGTDAVAAVGSTTTVNWLIGSTISAAGIGFLAYISQAHGAGDFDRAKKAASQAILASLILGGFFTALTLCAAPFIPTLMQVEGHIRQSAAQYFFILYTPMLFRCASIILGTVLRAAGDTKTPMIAGICVNASNVVLNFLLIFDTRTISLFDFEVTLWGAGLGVIGAAFASAVSFVLGGVIITVALLKHKVISPLGYSLKPDFKVLRPCLRIATPNAVQRFATSLGYVVFAAMVNSLGAVALAAHTIANTVESAFYIPGYGMQSAAATLAGNAVGAGDSQKLRDTSRMIILIEALLMILSGAALFFTAPSLVGLFTTDADVAALSVTVLRMVALSEPFYGVSIVIEGMLQGMGRTTLPFAVNVFGMWCIRIVGTLISIKLFSLGLVSAWACMIAHNLLLFAVFTVYYKTKRFSRLSGKL